MPRGLNNWKYADVIDFLHQHFFIGLPGKRTGHNFFQGFVDNKVKLVEVQFDSTGSISPKSLQHDIIKKSGIPQTVWKKWAEVGNKRLRKSIQYKGAKESLE